MSDELSMNVQDAIADQISTELETTLGNRLTDILSQVPRKFNIDQIRSDSGTIGDLDVDKVVLGDATIENIVLTDTNANLGGAQALMQNVRSVLELRFTLTWEVDLGWFGNWGDTENLGSLNFAVNVGNVSVPSLADIDMHIPTIHIANPSLSLQPVNNADLGGARLKKLQINNTDAPAGGFNLSGMAVGNIAIQDVEIPSTSTEKVTVQEFSPNQKLTLPGAEVRDLRVPSAKVGNITTDGFDLSAIASRRCLGVDLGILELRICVEPVIHMDIGSMVIHDAEISAMASKLEVKNITVPVTVHGIQMSRLNLNSIKINKISL